MAIMDAVGLFQAIAEEMQQQPGITGSKMFGSPCLKVGGKVFAALYKGNLVLKLPQGQVQELLSSGQGAPFDPGSGHVMREWVAVSPQASADWRQLAGAAKEFVAPVC